MHDDTPAVFSIITCIIIISLLCTHHHNTVLLSSGNENMCKISPSVFVDENCTMSFCSETHQFMHLSALDVEIIVVISRLEIVPVVFAVPVVLV